MLRRLIRSTGVVGTAIIIVSLFAYTLQVFLSHYLKIEEFALFNIAFSFYWILLVVLISGTEISLVKFVAESKNKVRKLLSNSIYIELVFALTISLLLVIYALTNKELFAPLILVAIMLLFSSLTSVFYGVFKGFEQMKTFASILSFDAFIKVVLSILLVILGFGLLGALFGFVIGSILTFLLCFYLLRRHVHFARMDTKIVKKIIYFSFPVALIVILTTVLVRADILLLKFFNTPNALIGIYTGSSLLSKFVYYITTALTIVLLPMVSSKKKIDMKKLFGFLFVFYGAGIIFTALFSKQLLILFYPDEFAQMSFILLMLVIGMAIISIDWVIATILIGRGKLKKALYPLILGTVFYFAASFYLIPAYSVFGVTLLLISTSVIVLLSYILIYRNGLLRS